ncbi:MAG: hypothetical protein II184_08155 [Clostridia bacterium]|nr:hypothetical protein [Clostridia bacterium]
MKDDLIFELMSGISDEHIKELEAFEAEQRAALAEQENKKAAAAAGVRGRAYRGGFGRSAVRAVVLAAVVLVFLVAGVLLSKYLNRNHTPETTPSQTETALPSPTLAPTAEPVFTPTGSVPVSTPTPARELIMPTEGSVPASTPTPAVTLTPTPAATLTTTAAPTAEPLLTPTGSVPVSTPTPAATLTSTPTATVAPTATPTAEPTATSTPYMTGRVEYYYDDFIPVESNPDSIFIDGTDVASINDLDGNGRILTCTTYSGLLISGYAYNSASPLKEIYCFFNDRPERHFFSGALYPREDIAAGAGFGPENAQKSGFGGTNAEQFMKLTDIRDMEEGIYEMRVTACFEDGSQLEICTVPLVVLERDPRDGIEALYLPFIRQPDGIRTEVDIESLRKKAEMDYGYAPERYYTRYVILGNKYMSTFDLGNLNLGLFSRCEIEYATPAGWKPQNASMSEPAFIALSQFGVFPGSGGDGPFKDFLLDSCICPCTEETELVSGYPMTVTRSAVIDLSNVDYAGHVWLTGFMNPDGPLIVTAIRFYS